MSEMIVARRYANALLAAIEDQNADSSAAIQESLHAWAEFFQSTDKTAEAFRDPVLAPAKKMELIAVAIEKTETPHQVGNLIKLCIQKGRIQIFPQIVQAFQDLLDEKAGVVRGVARTAFAVDETLQQKVQDKLSEITQKKVQLSWEEDRTLLGGFRIEVNHQVWDASLLHQLTRFRETIHKGVI